MCLFLCPRPVYLIVVCRVSLPLFVCSDDWFVVLFLLPIVLLFCFFFLLLVPLWLLRIYDDQDTKATQLIG